MAKELKAGGLIAEAGKKVQGFINVPGTPVEMPATLICGEKEGKTVVITGGTHGGEYPGIETSIRLAKDLCPKQVSGAVIIIHPVNVPAFYARLQYYGPYDGKNLNRMYPGKALGTVSERIAYFVKNELMAQADFYIDLHGGDLHEWLMPFVLYPTTGTPEITELSKKAASLMGVKHVVGSRGTNGTIGSAAVDGVPGVLGEIGARGLWCEDEVKQYYTGVMNVLKFLKVLPGELENVCEVTYLDRMLGGSALATGCWYPLIEPAQMVKKDQKLGEIRDFFGNVLAEYFAPQDAIVLHVISSLPVEEGDPVYALG